MHSALYFPILRTKQGEIQALGRLSPWARSRICPLLDVPRQKSSDDRKLDAFLSDTILHTKEACGTAYPVYLDVSRYDPETVTPDGRHAIEFLFDCASQLHLSAIPVTGPESIRGPGRSYLDAVRSVSKEFGADSAIRLPIGPLFLGETLKRDLELVLSSEHINPGVTDLLLDAEALARWPEDEKLLLLSSINSILRDLDELRFRSIVFCASSIPENVGPRA